MEPAEVTTCSGPGPAGRRAGAHAAGEEPYDTDYTAEASYSPQPGTAGRKNCQNAGNPAGGGSKATRSSAGLWTPGKEKALHYVYSLWVKTSREKKILTKSKHKNIMSINPARYCFPDPGRAGPGTSSGSGGERSPRDCSAATCWQSTDTVP